MKFDCTNGRTAKYLVTLHAYYPHGRSAHDEYICSTYSKAKKVFEELKERNFSTRKKSGIYILAFANRRTLETHIVGGKL